MRDHNTEYQGTADSKYAYDFDFRMHRFMMRAFEPFVRTGKALEIGCFEGDMTKLLAERFPELTVLEAADSLIEVARLKVPGSVAFVHGLVETAQLQAEYESIFLVHTLEHLDDPVEALAKVRQWLSPTGHLYLVVPNANAASRQIAVKMGLIETNVAVTAAEYAHGHRRTYALDALERDARAAQLRVIARGGICFKPFANFQFDLMLRNKVIDEAYLEGCYALGMQYPDLTASIYLVCGRN